MRFYWSFIAFTFLIAQTPGCKKDTASPSGTEDENTHDTSGTSGVESSDPVDTILDAGNVLDTDTQATYIDTYTLDTTFHEIDTQDNKDTQSDTLFEDIDLYSFAGGCFTLRDEQGRGLTRTEDNGGYSFKEGTVFTPFYMKASDLGTYLLYDPQGGYVFSENGPLLRKTSLDSDITLLDDTYVSGAEWELQGTGSLQDGGSPLYRFRHRKTGEFLAQLALTDDAQAAVSFSFSPAEGCTQHPELTLDAQGTVDGRYFDDGDVWGIAETHTHLLSNFGFGGGGIYHGSTFHRLGVEHALPDCSKYHGAGGKKDFFGYGYDHQGGGFSTDLLLSLLVTHELPEHNHETAGYPDFTDWPNATNSSTHQTQYHMWLKRAWMAGLRLLVQHATTNSVICEFMVGTGFQHARYSCNDMVAVDRIIDETYAMERYIDAQAGGPGKGFFRIVTTPQEAREIIGKGKMAVILGIETSNLFDCFSVPRSSIPTCDEAHVVAQLDKYHARGVRVLFPVHKYDNAFTGGDGNRDFIELGNFINSGHWSNFVKDDCPESPALFDRGRVIFGGLNRPRDTFLAPPPNNMAGFSNDPLLHLVPYVDKIMAPPLDGEYCQNAGLTDLGRFLLHELMRRGMVIELDHFNKRAYNEAFQILEDNDYPGAGTHGTQGPEGRIYALGGISKFAPGRCRDPNRQGALLDDMRNRVELIKKNGGYPGIGISSDLNGFAGARGPRFGEHGCKTPQEDPVTYPFTSFDGQVTFTQPRVGNRDIDFNTEGFVHIGLLPEIIEDTRRDAPSDTDLEPMFRSAEAYLRMWERAEERGNALRDN